MQSKRCGACGDILPVTDFHRKGDGHQHQCKDCRSRRKKARRRRLQAEEPEALRQRERNQRYRSRYGITWEQAEALLNSQGHQCAICGCHLTEENRHLDHNHVDGSVAGWLCSAHNTALGHFEDGHDIELLLRVIQYALRTRH